MHMFEIRTLKNCIYISTTLTSLTLVGSLNVWEVAFYLICAIKTIYIGRVSKALSTDC